MPVQRRGKVLELVSRGKISAEEGLHLLAALEQKLKKPSFNLELLSSKQEEPYFQMRVDLEKLPEFKSLLSKLVRMGLSSRIQIGGFRLDLSKLNWQRIMELAELGERGELFLVEMPGWEDEQIQLRISLGNA